jgi:hypothetical protein
VVITGVLFIYQPPRPHINPQLCPYFIYPIKIRLGRNVAGMRKIERQRKLDFNSFFDGMDIFFSTKRTIVYTK